jgi:uncharacterized protein YlxP (DUF503 family)
MDLEWTVVQKEKQVRGKMFVAIIKIELSLPGVESIKEKRNILNSVKLKIQNRFKAAVAEVDYQDVHTAALIGVTFISIKRDHAVSRGQKIITFLEEYHSDVFADYDMLIEEY